MADRFFILFAGTSNWSIGSWPTTDPSPVDLQLPSNAAATQIAEAVYSALQKKGWSGGPIAIGIPSAWCLSASISTVGLARNDGKAMLYRLEENLPLAAESVIADFVISTKDTALGACVKTELIALLVNALEAAGVAVQSIIPTALATAQGLAATMGQSPCLLLCHETGQIEPQLNIISLQDGSPSHWSLVLASAEDVKLQLELLSTESGSIPHIEAIDLDPDLTEKLADSCAQVIDAKQESGLAVAAEFCALVLKGREKPWIEFRRDQLAMGDSLRHHRKQIDAALSAAVLCLMTLAFIFGLRAHWYHQIEQHNKNEMLAAFQQHFPGWNIPVNVRAVVDAQYRRETGAAAGEGPATVHESALITLHDVILPMLAQDHFQVEHMSFHENAFEISGKLQSYEQVDALSKAARGAGMVVTPAQTRKNADGTWSFSLTGSGAMSPGGN